MNRKMFQYKEDYFFVMFCVFMMISLFASMINSTLSIVCFILAVGWVYLTVDSYLARIYPNNGEVTQQTVVELIPNKRRRVRIPSKRYIGTRSLANYRRASRTVARGR